MPFVTRKKEHHLLLTLFELHYHANSDSGSLQNLITGDESLVYSYDPEMKMQSSHWKTLNTPRVKKVHQLKSNVNHVVHFLRYSRNCSS